MIHTDELILCLEKIKNQVYEFDIIKLKSEPRLASVACPVLYEFEDAVGNSYSFRYRSGVMSLSTDEETLFVKMIDGLEWSWEWEEFCYYAYENRILIVDGEFGEDLWIDKLIK